MNDKLQYDLDLISSKHIWNLIRPFTELIEGLRAKL